MLPWFDFANKTPQLQVGPLQPRCACSLWMSFEAWRREQPQPEVLQDSPVPPHPRRPTPTSFPMLIPRTVCLQDHHHPQHPQHPQYQLVHPEHHHQGLIQTLHLWHQKGLGGRQAQVFLQEVDQTRQPEKLGLLEEPKLNPLQLP